MNSLFVKICGITNLDDALYSVEWGADALGFIFYEQSPRSIELRAVSRIVNRLPEHVTKVGVFVNPSRQDVTKVCREVKLSAIQLHGDQTPDEVEEYEMSVIKAFQVKEGFDVEVLRNYSVQAVLLDAFDRTKMGGTGKTFDWNIARKAKQYGKIILSGGLTPKNVDEAARFVRPYGVDVCSGVEESAGKKNLKKVKEFIQRAKTCFSYDET